MPLTKRAKSEPRRGPRPGPAEFPGRGVALFIPAAAVTNT